MENFPFCSALKWPATTNGRWPLVNKVLNSWLSWLSSECVSTHMNTIKIKNYDQWLNILVNVTDLIELNWNRWNRTVVIVNLIAYEMIGMTECGWRFSGRPRGVWLLCGTANMQIRQESKQQQQHEMTEMTMSKNSVPTAMCNVSRSRRTVSM